MQKGPVYAGRYRLGPELGRGGMGVVHLAHDEALDRDVALKTMALSARADPVAAGRFTREARALAKVHHPGIVTVYDYGEHDGEMYLVMQLVEGGSLDERLSGHRRLSPARTAELAVGVAAALDALHGRGLVHRDVKPSNILLEGPEQRPVLCDFGLAKPTTASDGFTRAGETVGTVLYMSPEQLAGDSATPASDVYALGCVLFHCLTGRPPFTGADLHDVATAHLSRPVPDVRGLVPDLPASVQPVLERCLAKDPAMRWAGAGAAARELQAAVQGSGAPAHAETVALDRTAVLPARPARPARPAAVEPPAERVTHRTAGRGRRFPAGLAAACAALVVATGLGGLALGFLTEGGTPPPSAADEPDEGAGLDPAERELAGLLSDEFGDCSPLPRSTGQVAKINCDRTPEGIASLHAGRWTSRQAMDEWFRTSYVRAGRYESGACEDFDGGADAQGSGRVDSRRGVGGIACYVNSNTHAVLLWQLDERLLSLLAIRDDPDAGALHDWWMQERDTVLDSP
ncbi:MAG: TOMM system kinase/cyclase fusion protein [uncultured Frankineae bacterium]|uniref:non-specific serine/threonine protein kinase n=1 Tax=uncultured Frankineae bacterium TaxID=437475 RepID=A0A6J4KJD1_9ACTN|nr:MAG: TOMM system kinase/cyclase fusion protein [uncultured Frankineae bacterium]